MNSPEMIQERLDRAWQSATQADDRELAARIRDEGHRLVFLLNGLVKATRLYSLDNQALDAPSRELAQVLSGLLETLGAVHVVLVEDQAYVNDVRLRVRPSEQPVIDQFGAELGRHEVGALSFHQCIDGPGLKQLAQAVSGPAEGAEAASALGKRLRELGDIEVSGRWRFRVGDETPSGPKAYADVLGRAEATLRDVLGRLAAGRMPNPLPVRRAVIDLVESLRTRPERAALAPFAGPEGAGERHLLSVCQLSLMLGQALGLEDAALSDLGVAAIFHDVGSLRVQDAERHPLAGARVLLGQRGFSEAKVRRLLAVVEHHDDYLDMRRDDLSPSLFARILHLVEDYDLLITHHPGQAPALSPAVALAQMWSGRGVKYDPILIALFAQVLGLYPPGTLLELSDGRWGVTVSGGRNRERFAHPVVKIVRAASGKLPPAIVDLDLYDWQDEVGVRRVVDPALTDAEVGGARKAALATAVA
jgi:HD domain